MRIEKLNSVDLEKYTSEKFLRLFLDMFNYNYEIMYNYENEICGMYTRKNELIDCAEYFIANNQDWIRCMVAYRQDLFVSDREMACLGLTLEQFNLIYVYKKGGK